VTVSGRRLRSLAPAGVALAVAVLLELVLRTPSAIAFNGIVFGGVNALTAAGLILVYRSTRIINFSHTAFGAVGASLTFQLLQLTKTPFLVAFPLGLVVAGGVALLFDVVIGRRLRKSARLVLTVATIAAAGFINEVGEALVNRLPIFPPNRDVLKVLGVESVRSRLPFPGLTFHVGRLPLAFGFPELFALELSVLGLFLVWLGFRYTRFGVAVRAMAENGERAGLLGMSVTLLSSVVWTVSGLLAGCAVIAIGALTTPGAAGGIAPGVLLPALAAAVLARMRSLLATVLWAVGISVVSQAFVWRYRNDGALVSLGLLVVIVASLLAQRRELSRSEAGGAVSWDAVEEQRAIPAELTAVPAVRNGRTAVIVIGLVAVMAFPFFTSVGTTATGAVVAIDAVVVLSLVVLTGWAGQVSLGQFGLVAVGAVVCGALIEKVGVPFWFAVPLAAAITGGLAVGLGLPALRVRGLFLAVVTFAFSATVAAVLFQNRYFGWLLPKEVHRPTLFLLDFNDERSMYFLCVAGLVAAIVVAVNLRRSRFGRVLIGLRDNEAKLQSAGISVVRTKLAAFAVSGAFAGFAGAMLAVQQRGLAAESFTADKSILVFLMAVVGGVTSVSGGLIGAGFFDLSEYFFKANLFWQVLRPLVAVILIVIAPGGMVSIINRVRDGGLRIIAQRRQLVVPSLFEDYDPTLLERRLVPLLEPSDASGLAVLPNARKYIATSELYPHQVYTPARRHQEETAVTAAVDAVSADEGTS
jgi:branched-chain amino acid transport system permease protein